MSLRIVPNPAAGQYLYDYDLYSQNKLIDGAIARV